MTLEEKIRITERNVARGLQGKADLDRLRGNGAAGRPSCYPTVSHELAALAAFDAEAPEHLDRPVTGTVPLADLLRHIEKHYSEFQLKNDIDCVLSLCATDSDRREVRKFARAKLTGKPYSGIVTVDSRSCECCGKPYQPRREDARFCSARCRVRANRRNTAGVLRITPRMACIMRGQSLAG